MKIFNILIIIFGLPFITGCVKKELVPVNSEPRIITKIQTEVVRVPVIMDIPKLHCEFKGSGTTPTYKMLECLRDHKKLLNLLRKKNEENKRKLRNIV